MWRALLRWILQIKVLAETIVFDKRRNWRATKVVTTMGEV